MSVSEAATRSRLEALKAARDALADQIDQGGGTVAQCVAQFRAVLAEIEQIEAPSAQKGTPLDELEARRAARGADAKGSSRAKGRVV